MNNSDIHKYLICKEATTSKDSIKHTEDEEKCTEYKQYMKPAEHMQYRKSFRDKYTT